MILSMHSRRCERVGLLLVLCAVGPGASGELQSGESSKANHRTIRESDGIAPWLVNSEQGLTIIGAALESRHTDNNADCSNLVHEIYERAGFTYSYSSSTQLYLGIKEFRRVLHPQPGDLVVWRGHVGIVISPVQHSFFSAMRSGRGVEFYDSPYWQGRGRPRFFRYLKSASRNQLSAATRNTNLKIGGSRKTDSRDSVAANQDLGAVPAVSYAQPASETGMLQRNGDEPDQGKPKPTVHKIQSAEDGVWEKTATKPSAGIPFASETTPTQPSEPGRWQGSDALNIPAKASHADERPLSPVKPPAYAPRPEPTQWAMSRYVPRPPWSLRSGGTSRTSIPRPSAGRSPRVPGFYIPTGQAR